MEQARSVGLQDGLMECQRLYPLCPALTRIALLPRTVDRYTKLLDQNEAPEY